MQKRYKSDEKCVFVIPIRNTFSFLYVFFDVFRQNHEFIRVMHFKIIFGKITGREMHSVWASMYEYTICSLQGWTGNTKPY